MIHTLQQPGGYMAYRRFRRKKDEKKEYKKQNGNVNGMHNADDGCSIKRDDGSRTGNGQQDRDVGRKGRKAETGEEKERGRETKEAREVKQAGKRGKKEEK